MSLGKVARKLKRVGKTAYQFRFTSTFEYIQLNCNGTWRPDNLRVIWIRSHRRVQSINIKWEPTEDRGPNGAVGKATFDPSFAVALIVTIYGDPSGKGNFEEKEYKYYIESDGPTGKKIVASFNIDVSEYATMASSKRHTLDMSFKPVSKKINKAILGITLQSEFMKQGTAIDDDMQSTFSAVSGGQDSLQFDEEDEEDLQATPPLDQSNGSAEKEEQQREAQGRHLDDAESPEKSGRKIVVSKEEWTPPSNHLYEDMPGEDELEEEEPSPSPLEAWLGDAHLTDCFGESVSREKLENADIIGLYFSANWCPPCRRFLPKLVKFYHHLKQNQKSFELLYISSDYSKQEMMKYMQEQQMPWVALAFDSTVSDKLRVDYNVSAIPILTIVSKEGIKLEERARKPVEQATSSSSVLKLYNKWVERSQHSAEGEGGEGEKKVGLLKTIKSAIHKQGKDQTSPLTGPGSATSTLESQKSQGGEPSDIEASGGASARITVEPRSRSRTKQKLKESGSLVSISAQEMEEKEEKVRHLEEVNMSLKQTNDDLNEEVAELKRQIGEFQAKLTTLEQSSRQLEDEKRELMANLNIRGWLVKRGVKGPTANVWRRRYFRCDQGSKIYYYKSSAEGAPQGYIDLDHVVSVQEVSPAQQDKNHATFLVQCEGRTFQLQAHDETTMRKWMSAIEYLKNWRQKNSSSAGP